MLNVHPCRSASMRLPTFGIARYHRLVLRLQLDEHACTACIIDASMIVVVLGKRQDARLFQNVVRLLRT